MQLNQDYSEVNIGTYIVVAVMMMVSFQLYLLLCIPNDGETSLKINLNYQNIEDNQS